MAREHLSIVRTLTAAGSLRAAKAGESGTGVPTSTLADRMRATRSANTPSESSARGAQKNAENTANRAAEREREAARAQREERKQRAANRREPEPAAPPADAPPPPPARATALPRIIVQTQAQTEADFHRLIRSTDASQVLRFYRSPTPGSGSFVALAPDGSIGEVGFARRVAQDLRRTPGVIRVDVVETEEAAAAVPILKPVVEVLPPEPVPELPAPSVPDAPPPDPIAKQLPPAPEPEPEPEPEDALAARRRRNKLRPVPDAEPPVQLPPQLEVLPPAPAPSPEMPPVYEAPPVQELPPSGGGATETTIEKIEGETRSTGLVVVGVFGLLALVLIAIGGNKVAAAPATMAAAPESPRFPPRRRRRQTRR